MKGSCGNSTCKIVKDGYFEKREEIRLQNKETQNMARKKSHVVVMQGSVDSLVGQ